MTPIAERLDLRPNEFAFYFEGERGVEVDALSEFLKRAATIARSRGAELHVVGVRDGSVAVVLRTMLKNAGKEFVDKPLDSATKVAALTATVAGAIIWAMSPGKSTDTPIAKSGAKVVIEQHVTSIKVITPVNVTVVMDGERARAVRERTAAKPSADRGPVGLSTRPMAPVRMIAEQAALGQLTGEITVVGSDLHFRPDNYRYWVPVSSDGDCDLLPGHRYRVAGHIAMVRGLPDHIIVYSAEQLPE